MGRMEYTMLPRIALNGQERERRRRGALDELSDGTGSLRHQILGRMRTGLRAYLSTQSVVDRFRKLQRQRETDRTPGPGRSQHDINEASRNTVLPPLEQSVTRDEDKISSSLPTILKSVNKFKQLKAKALRAGKTSISAEGLDSPLHHKTSRSMILSFRRQDSHRDKSSSQPRVLGGATHSTFEETSRQVTRQNTLNLNQDQLSHDYREQQKVWKAGNSFGMNDLGSLSGRLLQLTQMSPPNSGNQLKTISERSSSGASQRSFGKNTSPAYTDHRSGVRTSSPVHSTTFKKRVMQIKNINRMKRVSQKRHKSSECKSRDSSTERRVEPVRSQRLKRLARFIIVFCRTWKLSKERMEDVLRGHVVLGLITNDENSTNVLFDKSEFKASKEAKLSKDTRNILQKAPGTRTEQELHSARVVLRNYKSLAEYPVHMRRKIAERGWYEAYDSKRVLLREGYRANNFYFILSGSAIVTMYDPGKRSHNTVCFLKRGDSFGEQAIIHQSAREVSVVTKATTELLCITARDFFNIFMSGLSNSEDPFFKSVRFLDGWPVDLLNTNRRKSMLGYFKRGMVLSADTTKSDWVYLVKSGSCTVMKRIPHELPILKEKKKSDSSSVFPAPDTSLSHEQLIQRNLYSHLAHIQSQKPWVRAQVQPEVNIPTLPGYLHPAAVRRQSEAAFPDAIRRASFLLKTGSKEKVVMEQVIPSQRFPQTKAKVYLRGLAKQRKSLSKNSQLSEIKENVSNSMDEQQHQRQQQQQQQQEGYPEGDTFIAIQSLTKGMMFGLPDVLFGKQPGFSLVSNGAEIILIDKKFYLEHCPQKLLTRLRREVYPLPGDQELHRRLRETEEWRRHRSDTVNYFIAELHVRKSNSQQPRTLLE